jgi:alkylhydroperoxidase family enzyme
VYNRAMADGGDPATKFEAMVERALRGPGKTSVAQRAAAAGTGPVSAAGLPAVADAIVEKIRQHAYKVTDEDIAALKAAGLDEEQIFELTVAASIGVAQRRQSLALSVIDAATRGKQEVA